mmetsp:Transcript_19526/g.43506  ORF Transcript_19526/g.43506 Transcript_19526/m.43506 type:complete len:397 (-) Transcript_19526:121-1311(-)
MWLDSGLPIDNVAPKVKNFLRPDYPFTGHNRLRIPSSLQPTALCETVERWTCKVVEDASSPAGTTENYHILRCSQSTGEEKMVALAALEEVFLRMDIGKRDVHGVYSLGVCPGAHAAVIRLSATSTVPFTTVECAYDKTITLAQGLGAVEDRDECANYHATACACAGQVVSRTDAILFAIMAMLYSPYATLGNIQSNQRRTLLTLILREQQDAIAIWNRLMFAYHQGDHEAGERAADVRVSELSMQGGLGKPFDSTATAVLMQERNIILGRCDTLITEVAPLVSEDGLHVFEGHRERNALLDRNEERFFEGGMFLELKTALDEAFTTPLGGALTDLEECEKEFDAADVEWEWGADAADELDQVDYFQEWEHAECWGEDAGPDVWDEWSEDPIGNLV